MSGIGASPKTCRWSRSCQRGPSVSHSVAVAAARAARARFRAIFLTTLTTSAGLLPILTETSLQAQILIPLATSIVFGLLASTVLVLVVLPALYSILSDLGLARAKAVEQTGVQG